MEIKEKLLELLIIPTHSYNCYEALTCFIIMQRQQSTGTVNDNNQISTELDFT